jgi:recombinational DNA repair protein RecR
MAAEKSQSGQDATEEVSDTQIAGSENMWESAGEMHQITGKLTRPKNFKTKAQLLKEKKLRDNAEKQRIREEILATTPVTDFDTSSYSSYLASRSSQSKSEVEIHE